MLEQRPTRRNRTTPSGPPPHGPRECLVLAAWLLLLALAALMAAELLLAAIR